MRSSLWAPAMLFVVATIACESGSPGPSAPPPPGTPARVVDVFPDFEAAFNDRDAATYARILDDHFVFRLSDLDVLAGGMPPQWSRTDEIDYMTKLLDPDNESPMRCDSVYFDFNYSRFIELHKFNPPTAPDETWYQTTLYFDFLFVYTPGITLESQPGNRASFVIRNDGTDREPVWKIVEMHDLGPRTPALSTVTARGMPPWTLGAIKAMYRPQE